MTNPVYSPADATPQPSTAAESGLRLPNEGVGRGEVASAAPQGRAGMVEPERLKLWRSMKADNELNDEWCAVVDYIDALRKALDELKHQVAAWNARAITEEQRASAAEQRAQRMEKDAAALLREWIDDENTENVPPGSFLGRVMAFLRRADALQSERGE